VSLRGLDTTIQARRQIRKVIVAAPVAGLKGTNFPEGDHFW
jgi:hypothetical protein